MISAVFPVSVHTLAEAGPAIVARNRSTPAKSLTTVAGGAPRMRFINALSTPLAPNSTTMSRPVRKQPLRGVVPAHLVDDRANQVRP